MVLLTSRSWYIISNIFLPLDVKTFSEVLDNNVYLQRMNINDIEQTQCAHDAMVTSLLLIKHRTDQGTNWNQREVEDK